MPFIEEKIDELLSKSSDISESVSAGLVSLGEEAANRSNDVIIFMRKLAEDNQFKFDELKELLSRGGNELTEEEDPRAARYEDLKEGFSNFCKEVPAREFAEALYSDVCKPNNGRETAFIMETGERVRTQPFRLTDSIYRVPTRKMFEEFLDYNRVDRIEWEKNNYDCEDIARKFVTQAVDLGFNSVGRVLSWSGQHCFCIVGVLGDGEELDFLFLEPQNDKILEANEVGTGMYSLEDALIVIS